MCSLKKCTNNRKKNQCLQAEKDFSKKQNKTKQNKQTKNKTKQNKTVQNKLHMLIRKAKRKYFFKKFESSKNNMKQTWNMVNSALG